MSGYASNDILSFAIETLADGTTNAAYDAAKVKAVQDKLVAIRDGFQPTPFQGSADTFYITSTYNTQNATATINGATCEYILGLLDTTQTGA